MKNKAEKAIVPILMYHSIGRPLRKEDAPFFVSAERFKKQMEFLKKEKYQIIGLSSLISYIKGKTSLSEKTIVITFDDGTESIYTNAFPILKSLGFCASVFLTINYIEKKDMAEKSFLKYEPLSWQQIKEMLAGGVSFYPHSLTHPRLTKISPEEARLEIVKSREILESILGRKADIFGYPYGDFNDEVKEMLKDACYVGAVDAWGGINTINTDLYALKRIPVFERDNGLQLQLKLVLGLDKVTPGVLAKHYWEKAIG